MKKLFVAEYFVIILTLALPPCFKTGGDLPLLNYSLSSTGLCLIFVGIFIFTKKTFFPPWNKKGIVPSLLWGLSALAFMLAISFTVSKLSNPTPMKLPKITGAANISAFVLSVGAFAFFEELLYRVFIFEGGLFLLGETTAGKKNFCILFALGLFAAAHRYMGMGAVVNAFLLGAILHLLYLKTGRFEIPCLTHCAYNFILFLAQS